jgi:hypothetical protein
MRQLTELLGAAGHSDFRDARGPLGLTQRQAGGKFTRDEAEELIGVLEAEVEAAEAAGGDGAAPPSPRPAALVDRKEAAQVAALQKLPAALLAAELQRRGWVVMEP